jgi:hypothetical protein
VSILEHISRADVYLFALIAVYVFLSLRNKLPAVESIRRIVSALDDRGGNIVVLAIFSGWFFLAGMHAFYFALNLISQGKIDAKDAILMMFVTWLTGSAFGGSFGAMLKTLNGQISVSPPTGGAPVPTALKVEQLPAERKQ